MNNTHLIGICDLFKLGLPIGEPERIFGGLLHKIWRVSTEKSSYAIKQLSSNIDLTNKAIVQNYNLTEEIASRFSEQKIPALSALSQKGTYLNMLGDTGFLIYPWEDGAPLQKDMVSEYHALKIATILAKMHAINLSVPEITEPEFDIHSSAYLIEVIQKAKHHQCPFSNTLIELQSDILVINTAFQNSVFLLKKQVVVSHGDLDQKNVLWDKINNPILIDWECARKLNPTHELVNTCLDWSGITTNFNKDIFLKMIRAYSASDGHLDNNILPAAFNAVLGNWINWMAYNIERACMIELEQKTLGIEQVTQVLRTIIKLKNIIPELIENILENT
jgi:Ser/Thr protein kinase RdoA (MazF antagonist)